jgi:3',5'-cyclic-nucleotide phosphodiesterase
MAYQAHSSCAFGVKGGIDEITYLLTCSVNTQNYICLDAGTINAGIEKR